MAMDEPPGLPGVYTSKTVVPASAGTPLGAATPTPLLNILPYYQESK
jgi:hypothetical protein